MDTKTLCLAVLSRGEASGYEIKKSLEETPISAFQEVSFGSLYPALNKLSQEGLVACRQEPQTKRPDKKVYALTPAGRARLVENLEEDPGPDRYRSDFLFTLSYAHLLDPKLIQRFLDARISFYETRLDRMCGCDLSAAAPGGRFVHGFGQAVYKAALDYLKAQRTDFLKAQEESWNKRHEDGERREGKDTPLRAYHD